MDKRYIYHSVDIRDLLEKEFPEFIASKHYKFANEDRELVYVFVGGWGSFVERELLIKNNTDIAVRALKFVDKIMNDKTSDKELVNLLFIELFENIVGTRKGIHLAVDNLHDEALHWFGLALQNFRTLDESEMKNELLKY